MTSKIAEIQLSEDTARLFERFVSILNESPWKKSEVLDVTAEVLEINDSDYSSWWLRRRVLEEATVDELSEELEYARSFSMASPKNYQVWYHRKWIVERLPSGNSELKAITESLAEDSKNHSAWMQRIDVLSMHDEPELDTSINEVAYVDSLLEKDPYNNSAWTHRYVIITGEMQDAQTAEEKRLIWFRENLACLYWLKDDANNQSAWNYIRAFYRYPKLLAESTPSAHRTTSCFYWRDMPVEVSKFIMGLEESSSDKFSAPGIFTRFLIECEEENIEQARRTLSLLVERDPIRKMYYSCLVARLSDRDDTNNKQISVPDS